eukprot:IDg20543t1
MTQQHRDMDHPILPSLGDIVEVYWPDDDAYYTGRIAAYDGIQARHRIDYF